MKEETVLRKEREAVCCYVHVHMYKLHKNAYNRIYMYMYTQTPKYTLVHVYFNLPIILATHSDVPTVKFKETRSRLKFLSLTSSVEALSVLEVVRVECGKVGEMRLFHTGASKPLRLEEYDQAQQQATSHVYMYSNIPYVV